MAKIKKPKVVTKKHLEYLDWLRGTGLTNMFGARPYVQAAFPDLSEAEAARVLVYWMESFGEREHKETENGKKFRDALDKSSL